MLSIIRRAARYLRHRFLQPPMDPARAYDLWSATYDEQTQNLLLFLDEQLLTSFLPSISLQGKVVVDVGCGTGRHWPKLMEARPSRLVGYDASAGMLARLRHKFPQAEAYVVSDHRLPNLPAEGVDLLVSTLSLGYMRDQDAVLAEWSRVLRPGGELIVTDLHPGVAATGDRGFRLGDRSIQIQHYAHSLASVRASAARHHLLAVRFEETVVDDSVRSFYEAQGASRLFDRIRGTPIIFGLQMRKENLTSEGER